MKKNRANFYQDEGYADEFDEVSQLFADTMTRINELEKEGQLSSEEAEDSRLVTREEYRAALEEMADDEEDNDEEEDADYEHGGNLAEFHAGSNFGAALVEVVNEYENPEDVFVELSERTGYEPEDLLGLVTGENFPDDDLATQIATALDLDDESAEVMLGLAALDRGEFVDDYEEEEEEDERDAEYRAAFSALAQRNKQLEAEFAAAQEERELNDLLIGQQLRAQEGVSEGWLPPAIFRAEFGDFATDSDRVATFSAVCNGNNVDSETEIYAREKMLAAFERMGPIVNFGRIADEELEEYDEDDAVIEAEANRYAKQLNNRRRIQNGGGNNLSVLEDN
jgi:hypothetical protein